MDSPKSRPIRMFCQCGEQTWDLREIYLAPSRALAEVAIDVFAEKYQAKHLSLS